IFTRATKAASGHDINITEKQAADLVGKRVLERVRDLTLRLYAAGSAHAESRGIIVADTKFEFGLLPLEDDDNRRVEDRVILIDEVLTPDSSRFWPADGYRPGGPQPSFDKQFVRDYLERINWNKQPPLPSLPRRCRREDAREICRSVPPAHRTGARMIADRLERLIEEMVDKGVRFDDAVREFEKRFIVRVLGKEDGSLTR